MGRPKTRKITAGTAIHLSFTIDGDVVHGLDMEAARMTAERPGMIVTRTSVIRVALNEWLATQKGRR